MIRVQIPFVLYVHLLANHPNINGVVRPRIHIYVLRSAYIEKCTQHGWFVSRDHDMSSQVSVMHSLLLLWITVYMMESWSRSVLFVVVVVVDTDGIGVAQPHDILSHV